MNKPFLVRATKNIIVVAILAVLLLVHATIVCAEDAKKQDEWRFTLVPYIWLPSVSGSFNYTLPAGTGPGNTNPWTWIYASLFQGLWDTPPVKHLQFTSQIPTLNARRR